MQFLHEEFLGKVYRFIKKINIMPIRIILMFIFWGAIIAGVIFLTLLYMWGRQKLVFLIIGIFAVAEGAHFLRKSRERAISMKVEESGNIKDQLVDADLIKKDKVKRKKEGIINQEGLLRNSTKVKIVKKKLKD